MYTDHQFKTRCNEGTPVLNSHVDISRTQMDSVSTGSISTLLLPLLKLLLTLGAQKSESWTLHFYKLHRASPSLCHIQ